MNRSGTLYPPVHVPDNSRVISGWWHIHLALFIEKSNVFTVPYVGPMGIELSLSFILHGQIYQIKLHINKQFSECFELVLTPPIIPFSKIAFISLFCFQRHFWCRRAEIWKKSLLADSQQLTRFEVHFLVIKGPASVCLLAPHPQAGTLRSHRLPLVGWQREAVSPCWLLLGNRGSETRLFKPVSSLRTLDPSPWTSRHSGLGKGIRSKETQRT